MFVAFLLLIENTPGTGGDNRIGRILCDQMCEHKSKPLCFEDEMHLNLKFNRFSHINMRSASLLIVLNLNKIPQESDSTFSQSVSALKSF